MLGTYRAFSLSYNLCCTQVIAGTAPATTCILPRPLLGLPLLQPVLYPGHCWDSPRYSLRCTQAIAGTAPATTCCTKTIAGTAPATTCVVPRPLLGQPQLQPVVPGPLLGQPQVQPVVSGPLPGQPQLRSVVPGPLPGQPQVQPVLYRGHCWGPIAQPQLQPVLYPGHCWDSPMYNLCCTQAIAGTAPGTISVVPTPLLETYSTAQATSSTQQLMRHPELRSCV